MVKNPDVRDLCIIAVECGLRLTWAVNTEKELDFVVQWGEPQSRWDLTRTINTRNKYCDIDNLRAGAPYRVRVSCLAEDRTPGKWICGTGVPLQPETSSEMHEYDDLMKEGDYLPDEDHGEAQVTVTGKIGQPWLGWG